jgi:hypothetical protein
MRCDKAAQPSVFPGLLDRIVHAGSDRRSEIVRLMTVITISTGAAARFEDDTHPQPSDVVRRSQVGELGEQIAVRSSACAKATTKQTSSAGSPVR